MDFDRLSLAVSRTENFMVRPTVLIQILRQYDDKNASPRQLEKVIEQDPALTAKVLRVANSSAYGNKAAVSVGRALSVLGLNALRSIAISLAYQEILNRKSSGAGFDRIMFGRHCFAVAVGSRAIARIKAPQLVEEMYVAGLMHDIGVLALDRFCPGLLNVAIKRAQMNQISLAYAEKEVFQYDHCDVGGIVSDKWNLSKVMSSAIRYHYNPDGETPKSLPTAIVIGANYLAYQCGFPAMPNIIAHPEGALYFNELGLTKQQAEMVEATIIAEVEQADRTFGEIQPVAA